MQAIGFLLVLISIGLIAGPVGAVAYTYRDDLPGLVVPDQIRGIINGDTGFKNINGDLNRILNNFAAPNFVNATVDESAKTFSVRINVTNPLNHNVTLNTLGTEVQTPNSQQIAAINITSPITIPAGESTIIQIDGTWTEAGENYITTHKHDTSITITLTGIVVDVNGIKLERDNPLTVTIPLSFAGITLTGQ
jgi:hypothetical protein